ncbi:MAG: hypothetical protein WC238_01400 [Parcubacteria group bacterium]|jgi:hypothetical protein
MHQTFYIDIDEEITSIVERLRKAQSTEIIIVVPKRALLIQSIVNLKLLKKEADNLQKELVIVTQDKLGKLLIEKTGIPVEQKLDDVAGEEMALVGDSRREDRIEVRMSSEDDEQGGDSKKSIDDLGSAEYFDEASAPVRSGKRMSAKPARGERPVQSEEVQLNKNEVIVNKELITDIGADIKKSTRGRKKPATFDIVKNIDIKQAGVSDADNSYKEDIYDFGASEFAEASETNVRRTRKAKVSFEQENFETGKSEELANFLNSEGSRKYKAEADKMDYASVQLSGKFWKYFAWIGSAGALVVVLSLAYLFLPKVNIKIFAKTKAQSVDAQVSANIDQVAVDLEQQAIPAKALTVDDQLTSTFPVTGSSAAAKQKAHGTLTIYNEFSASPQPLVATTRFQSADGKIFRLIKATTVPGMTNVGGQSSPGAIEVEVVADESGSAYNVDPTTFSIPGFKDSGTEKYTKIYAKSFKAMTGGGTSDGSSNVTQSISAADITNAKTKTLADLTANLKKAIKDSGGSDQMILEDAINISDATYTVSNTEGEIVDKFTVTVKAKASAVAFKEKDLRSVLASDIAKAGSAAGRVSEDNLILQYGKADTDFTKSTITIRVNAAGKIGSDIDLENLEKGILGKSEEDFKAYLKTYTAVDKAEIVYWPAFISGKIPAYASRVNIELDPVGNSN